MLTKPEGWDDLWGKDGTQCSYRILIGTEIYTGDDDIEDESLILDYSVFTATKPIGNTPCFTMECCLRQHDVEIPKGAWLELQVQLRNGDIATDWVSYGEYKINKRTEHIDGWVTLSCRNRMQMANQLYIKTETPEENIFPLSWENSVIEGDATVVEDESHMYTPDMIPGTALRVTSVGGYEFCVIPCSSEGVTNAPNPYWDAISGEFSSTGAVWYEEADLSVIWNLGYTNAKLIARKTDLSVIDPSTEGKNIQVYVAESWPKSMLKVMEETAEIVGVTLDPSTWIREGEDWMIAPPLGKTIRSIWSSVAAAHGGNFVITPQRTLLMVYPKCSAFEGTETNLFDLSLVTGLNDGKHNHLMSMLNGEITTSASVYMHGYITYYGLRFSSGNYKISLEVCCDSGWDSSDSLHVGFSKDPVTALSMRSANILSWYPGAETGSWYPLEWDNVELLEWASFFALPVNDGKAFKLRNIKITLKESYTTDTVPVEVSESNFNALGSVARVDKLTLTNASLSIFSGASGENDVDVSCEYTSPSAALLAKSVLTGPLYYPVQAYDMVFDPLAEVFDTFSFEGLSTVWSRLTIRCGIVPLAEGTSESMSEELSEYGFEDTPVEDLKSRIEDTRKYVDAATESVLSKFTSQEIFNALTNNGEVQGLYFQGGQIFINASYIGTGVINATLIQAGILQSKDGSFSLNLDTGEVTISGVASDEDLEALKTEGVEKVITPKMKYEMSDNGLRIQKPGSAIRNTVDDEGMEVYRNDEVILRADISGVEAVDVTVRNFLNLGDRNRFEECEDYYGTASIGAFCT